MTCCPDCGLEIPDEEFVKHRESEHPAETRVVTVHEPLHSGERMGWEE